MTIIAIDPSLTNTAYVVLNYKGGKLTPIESRISQTKKAKAKDCPVMQDRVDRIRQHTKTLFDLDMNYKPDYIVSELPSGSQSSSAAVSVGYACGLIALSGLISDSVTCTPMEVKKQVGGINPGKKEVIEYVDKRYPNFLPRKHNGEINLGQAEHIADAIVVAEVCVNKIN